MTDTDNQVAQIKDAEQETVQAVATNKAETPQAVEEKNEQPITLQETITQITPLDPDIPKEDSALDVTKLGILNDVYIMLTIEIGRAQIKIKDLLNLTKGSIIELDKLAGEPVSIYANGKLISTGNIITANGKYCVRLTTINQK